MAASTGFSGHNEIVSKEEDLFFATHLQLPSFDFCGNPFSLVVDWHSELSIQESFLDCHPFVSDPLYASLDIGQSEDDINGLGVWKELGPLFEPQKQLLLLGDTNSKDSSMGESTEEKRKVKKCREEKVSNNSISKALTRERISKYFYMPITQAAKELNVGLTLLKKRCRELDIRRWPHRKLMSLQTLIENLQQMKVEGKESEEKLKEAIEILEREKRMLEEMPDMDLEHKTKRLRQACFKANYKKRKLMGSCSSSSSGSLIATTAHDYITANDYQEEEEDDDEEIKSLLEVPFPYDNLIF
ncbi:hypothetical protein JCGZ_11632 [Jatropha curcas]|uniref:RWP-RK domain-containing protein n=1 Tax=Jatropha curcas TaxID=180498 RepID=A0A067K4X8_JATCU|nr:hypothetical protein JCGZ_11632 [Jatropha curcas]